MKEYDVVLQNEPVDISDEFSRQHNHFFVADRVAARKPGSPSGEILWKSMALKQRVSYHQLTLQLEDYKTWQDVPPHEYEDDQRFPFSLSFVTPRTVRLRVAARPWDLQSDASPMLVGPPPSDGSWSRQGGGDATTYHNECGSVLLGEDPLRFEFRDASGKLLTRSWHLSDTKGVVNTNPVPFCFVRNSSNLHRHLAATFSLSPDERLYGGGESFTRLDKRGQKLVLWTSDAYSAQTPRMYKPVPFFMSSRGYGMFFHTSAPLTLDLGRSYDGAATVFLGDDALDLFFFFGSPKEVLSEYTALTGRAPTPPPWSFGLWMGRASYSSSEEVRSVAKKLRAERIPSDVVHIDTDWPEVPFRCDFEFSGSRFPDAEEMLAELKRDGFRVSLWQYPYLHPNNRLHEEAIRAGYVVLAANGKPPVDDAVIDLSNPEAVRWYKEKLAGLLEKGVAAFTSDFGEAAPLSGIYDARRSHFLEHNLYPLRYNQAVSEITEEVGGESIQWARSAWAGSQRYPLHWGGDPETDDGGMAGTLRGGLSLGLCGFSFWGHFVGGFPEPAPPELYLRWLAFGVFSSHTRCHGAPPTEPWEYGEEFTAKFRGLAETRYRLIPYVYAQARRCSTEGHPMIRPLFFEYPEDRTSWFVEDEYLFGNDLLVAPLVEEAGERQVYLPPGVWISYEDGCAFEGSKWHRMSPTEIPIVVLVRDGAAVPHAPPAQHTGEVPWEEIELRVFREGSNAATGLLALPGEEALHELRLEKTENGFELADDPLRGRVRWSVRERDSTRASDP